MILHFLALYCSSTSSARPCVASRPRRRNLLSISNCESVGGLTLKTLGTVTVSLVDSPLAEMTVTVGLDMVSRVGVAVVSIADLSWCCKYWRPVVGYRHGKSGSPQTLGSLDGSRAHDSIHRTCHRWLNIDANLEYLLNSTALERDPSSTRYTEVMNEDSPLDPAADVAPRFVKALVKKSSAAVYLIQVIVMP